MLIIRKAFVSAVLRPACLAVVLALGASACGVCAQGPGFIKEVSIAGKASQAIDHSLPLDGGERGNGPYVSVTDNVLPTGVTVSIEKDVVRLRGTAAVGTHRFTLRLAEAPGDACAAWSRYDVTLTVAP